jgi:xanthine dehydrogenase accessory factor
MKMPDKDLFEQIVKLRQLGKSTALATVVYTHGSTPQRPGSKMLVSEDGRIFGTIGGGKTESQVIDLAKKCISTKKTIFKTFRSSDRINNKNQTICGGTMKVFVEPINPPESLIILGAGHVGLATFQICNLIGFSITVADDRKEFASKKRLPGAKKVICKPFDKMFKQLDIHKNTLIVIATRRHEMDEVCLHHTLRSQAKYIGLLGSRNKWNAIKKRLRNSGFKQNDIKRVHCPIGLDIGAVTPNEIAVSIAAQLIQFRS